MSKNTRLIKAPTILSVLDISTGHITKEDDSLIKVQSVVKNYRGGSPIIAYEYPEGYFVYVSEDIHNSGYIGAEYKASLKKFGLSQQFIRILEIASELGLKYVQFDCDGTHYPELKTYNW